VKSWQKNRKKHTPPREHVVVHLRIGAWECSGMYHLSQLNAVLSDVERAIPDWHLSQRRSDPMAHARLCGLLMTMAQHRADAKILEAAVKAATWLAVHSRVGRYRAALEKAVAEHGHAHLTVQTDALGNAWGFMVSNMVGDMSLAMSTIRRASGDPATRSQTASTTVH